MVTICTIEQHHDTAICLMASVTNFKFRAVHGALAFVYCVTHPPTERSGLEEYKPLLGTVTRSDDSLKRRAKYGAMRVWSVCMSVCLSVSVHVDLPPATI